MLTGCGGLYQPVCRKNWPTACSLNNTDINTRTGWYSKAVSEATTGGAYDEVGSDDPSWGGAAVTFPRIQGADICGEIVA